MLFHEKKLLNLLFHKKKDRLNASGGCEIAVTGRNSECGVVQFGKRFSLQMKGHIYRSYIRLAMLCGGETWCLRKTEVDILRRAERSIVRAVCSVKLLDKRNTEELMDMLGLKQGLKKAEDKLERTNSVRWYGHVWR